ncbi:hypothetical protein G9A89_009859 [Geosiphon pyriformis]|nr:hypothetical protein G9A89_009859 [Geosiphon pyriformis]
MDNSNSHSSHLESNPSTSMIDALEIAREENCFDTFVFVDGRRYIVADNSIKTYLVCIESWEIYIRDIKINSKHCYHTKPNDNIEAARANHYHYLHKFIWRGLYSSPVKKRLMLDNAKTLDIGCGIGMWTLDMAIEYPLSTFIGIDVAPIFPKDGMKPPNAGYIETNLVNGIAFPDATFDFVHQRYLLTEIPKKQYMRSYLESLGITVNSDPAFPEWLKNAGLVNIQSSHIKMPLGIWGGTIGKMMIDNFVVVFKGLKVILMPRLGISESEFDEKIEIYQKEVNEYRTEVSVFRY